MKTAWILLSLLVLCGGCQSSLQTKSDKTIRLMAAGSGSEQTYRVLRTNDLDPSKTIKIQVKGQVVHPGVFELLQGTTLLEAILETGGFAKYAAQSQIRVTNSRGDKFRYGFMRNESLRLVWCGGDASVVLEDGMVIEVPGTFHGQ
jgi:protein involved in polysaccharide export with SLBB domain